MKQFNVLNRRLALYQNYLLEASAGTGKTFSIQNIVVRLLIEKSPFSEPFTVNKILIVTFTRAATRDLKIRIRKNIEQALDFLTNCSVNIPDYLQAILEKGEEAIQEAKKNLQQALYSFDQAQIFTIHAFCARMLRQSVLEGDVTFQNVQKEEPFPPSILLAIIRDFFRTEVRHDLYSPAQLSIILKEDPEQRKLLRIIQKGHVFSSYSSYKELYLFFTEKMKELQKKGFCQAEKARQDFIVQSTFYKNYKIGETKAETLSKILLFTALLDKQDWTTEDFDRLIRDDLVWVKALDKNLIKNKPFDQKLNYPTFTEELQQTLAPLIQKARSFPVLLARLAKDCQKFIKRYQQEEEKLSPDDLLRKMDKALDNSHFLKQVQANYQAVVIDEFQDTDPLQWQIFSRLFLSKNQEKNQQWQGCLYLVGDPKQSIYSFRQADIYTYLKAAKEIGENHCFSLDTNFRSQPQLVNALNIIFCSKNLPVFLPLPKKNSSLTYQAVQASSQQDIWIDEKKAIHFFIADGQAFDKPKIVDIESEIFFPFIAREINRLVEQKKLNYQQFAVLVRDRHQALRLTNYLDHVQLPYVNQRGNSLVDSPAFHTILDILRAVLQPQNQGLVRQALANPLLGWKYEEIKKIDSLEKILVIIQKLRSILFTKGFSSFFENLLQVSFREDQTTVREQLLLQENGIDIYHDIQQIADIIIDHYRREWNSPEGIIAFLDLLQQWNQDEDERVKRFQDPTKDGVKILTLHLSKGLEFEIVFALGLVNRTSMQEELIPLEKSGKIVLQAIEEDSFDYRQFCEENDAEKMRQFYVALTRAKKQVYIPIALHVHSSSVKIGDASPLDLYLGRLGQPVCSYEELYERIKKQIGNHLLSFLKENDKSISYSIHQKIECENLDKKIKKLEKSLVKPVPFQPKIVPFPITSFTQLNRKKIENNAEEIESEKEIIFDYFSSPISTHLEVLDKNIFSLPAGIETGNLIHEILKKIDFSAFQSFVYPKQARSLIQPYLQYTSLQEWEEIIATLLFNVLKTPLPGVTNSFCLSDLSSSCLYKEMPFLFSAVEESKNSSSLLKGVIDCIFNYQGLYYLVDWKSHWLGNNLVDYQQTELEKIMHEQGYFLQAAIYQKALEKYLQIVESRPFSSCFGGIYYLFLRGMQPLSQTGIYFISAEKLSFALLDSLQTNNK